MTNIEAFHFLRPEWLWGLLPVACAALLLLRRGLDSGRWKHAVDPELVAWLVETGWRSRARPSVVAVLLAWGAVLVAIAGPTWERRPQPVSRTDDALVVVLDLSLSMYAQDITPSRLVRARLKIADVLEARQDRQTALVVYAGDAHVAVPLTDDIRTINNLLPSLEPGVMPVLGSRVQDALAAATELLDEAEARTGRILLITDEIVDTSSAVGGVADRYPVLVLGVGTNEGAPIPLTAIDHAGYLEANGRPVVATLDEGPLRALAKATRGAYARFERSDSDLRTLLGDDVLERRGEEGEREQEFTLWIDMGPWLVLLVLPVALLCFRRGVVALLALSLLAPVERAEAAEFNWFATPDQRGYRALREGRGDEALELFEDPAWQAVTRYRTEAYEAAASAFSSTDAQGLYNRGTSLARAMKLAEARAALTAALTLAPDHADARHNLELVDKLLETQRQNGGNQDDSQQDDSNGAGNESGASQQAPLSRSQSSEPGGADSAEDERDEQQPQAATADGEAPREGGQSAEPSQGNELAVQHSREQEQALEQWLRRIPDEPGALLRRKFRYESDRRYRQGLRRTPQDQQPW